MDKDGPLCAEQMLYAACFRVMAEISEKLARTEVLTEQEYEKLAAAIEEFFWDEEKGAYIDSFTSGKRNVTRHANIFAVLFAIADKDKQEKILTNVLEMMRSRRSQHHILTSSNWMYCARWEN